MRLALAQTDAAMDPAARLEWLAATLPQVRGQGAELLLLPELFAHGYNIGDAVRTRAEPLDGPTAKAMAALARRHSIALHYGFAETSGEDVFNAAICLGPQGDMLVHQRKLMLPPGFEQDYFTQGAGCSFFDYCGLRIATLICYDAEFPETVRHVAQLGAQLVLVPTALGAQWGHVADTVMPARAFENGVALAYANSAGTENGMAFLGHSVIVGPDGTRAAQAGGAAEVIFADITAAQVEAAQSRLPYLRDVTGLKLD